MFSHIEPIQNKKSLRKMNYDFGLLRVDLNIPSLRETGLLSDATLEADGKSYPAHKVILALASDYFKALFTSGFKDP